MDVFSYAMMPPPCEYGLKMESDICVDQFRKRGASNIKLPCKKKFKTDNLFKAILVTGGTPESRHVEALTSDGTPLCVLNPLSDKRSRHSMNEDLLCGGQYTQHTCLQYKGSHKKLHTL